MAELSYAARKKLPSGNFVFPESRSYPIPDKAARARCPPSRRRRSQRQARIASEEAQDPRGGAQEVSQSWREAVGPNVNHVEAAKKKAIPLPPKDRWGEPLKTSEGTHCSNCEYLKDAEKMVCGNSGFIAWNGSNKIPASDPDKYCSIWWEAE